MGIGSKSWPTTGGTGELQNGGGVRGINGVVIENKIDGVSFVRSKISIRHKSDGTSNTYMMGEKRLRADFYYSGLDGGDNETWCTGFNNDNYRTGHNPPINDQVDNQRERKSTDNFEHSDRFGSPHPSTWHAAFCDGSVQGISYDIDIAVHTCLASRDDGQANCDPSQL